MGMLRHREAARVRFSRTNVMAANDSSTEQINAAPDTAHELSASATITSHVGAAPSRSWCDRLGPIEYRRRLWHIVPGFLPFLLWPVPAVLLPPLIRLGILLAVTFAVGVWMFLRYARIRRPDEPWIDRFSILAYSGSVFATLVLFPLHSELALTVLAVLAFGDGSATVGGLLFQSRRLPWNDRKSVAGTACFILVGTIMSAIIYWGEANGRQLPALAFPVSFIDSLLCGLFATALAAIVESLPLRTNDNLNVGIAALVGVVAAHSVFVGW